MPAHLRTTLLGGLQQHTRQKAKSFSLMLIQRQLNILDIQHHHIYLAIHIQIQTPANFLCLPREQLITKWWDSRKTSNVLNTHSCHPGPTVQTMLIQMYDMRWQGKTRPLQSLYLFLQFFNGPQERMNTIYTWLQLNVLPKPPVIFLFHFAILYMTYYQEPSRNL